MIKSKIVVGASVLRGATKAGPYCVTRARLGDLSGRPNLPLSEYIDVFIRYEADFAKEADRMRRHGRADPTGLVTLDREGIQLSFGKIGRA